MEIISALYKFDRLTRATILVNIIPMMRAHLTLAQFTAFTVAFALITTPNNVAACMPSLYAAEYVKYMEKECRKVLLNPNRFLKKIKKGNIKREKFKEFVVAFDNGKYGCGINKDFTFNILKNFYSTQEQKLSEPYFLLRYYLNFPENYEQAEQSYIGGLAWLFADGGTALPKGWTADQARTFVEMPQHWPIALAGFGNSQVRDDAVFESVIDPQSRYFDRQLALRLAGSSMRHQIRVASLFVDPRFGPTDLGIAEKLLPIYALYDIDEPSQMMLEARSIWARLIDAYTKSSTPDIREKGLRLRAKMLPSTPGRWPSFEPPQDGRVWLSLNDWPRSIPNPFPSGRGRSSLLSAYDYPPGALRNNEAGALRLAVRFGSDGKFGALEVMQSSGSANLDEEAVRIILRRSRPKVSDMTLEGYHGQEVVVPWLVVNWEIAPIDGGLTYFADGIITVVNTPLPQPTVSSCGGRSSVFL